MLGCETLQRDILPTRVSYMLQSPAIRVQRQQQLNSACENHLLEAKQAQNVLTSLPAQKRTYQRQQHRRQLSVPDESLLLKSSMGPKMMSFDMDGSAVNMNGNVIMNGTFNIFTVTEQPSLSNQSRQAYTPVPHQSQYSSFPYPRPHNQHIRKGSMDSVQPKRRGSLLNPNMRPLAPAGRLDDAANIIAQDIYAHSEHGIPNRAQTTPMMSVSTFDLAPIPHAGHYVNLSSLAMGSPDTELDEHSFYSHSPISMSPGFPPHDVQQHLAMFDTSMAPANDLTSSPVLPAQNPVHGRPLLAPAPVPTETAPIERSDMLSGITMEEIASFIDGPEPSDGKWVCLYEGCAKRFGRKENIKSHVQTHLGDRQFKCVVCKKCFVRQHDLKRHSKIHTGVKPYPCLCGNSFARHDALTRHRQRGMCIGAFEGVVRKEVKRGRPRKKPLPKEENQSGTTSSGASDTSSGESTGPDETTSTSPTPSAEEDSPGGMPDMGSSDEYSPPTSPGYDIESFTITDKNSSEEFGHGQYMTSNSPDYTTQPNIRKPQSVYGSPGEFSSSVEMGMFTQEMLDLTALERDPTILNFEEGYIKSELLDTSEQGFYGV